MADLSRAIHGIPVILQAERDSVFPTPERDQRYQDRTSGDVYRYDGASWGLDLAGAKGAVFDVRAYGATAGGVADDRAAITAAQLAATAVKGTVYFPPGTYRVTVSPTAIGSGGATITYAFPLLSDLHVVGAPGATIKLADSQSTDGTPKRLALWFTNAHQTNVSFVGLTFDMNGANNLQSPSRPATYNNYDNAAIQVGGDGGRMDDVLIADCTFQNHAGANCIVTAEPTSAGATLGSRWRIARCTFRNNGLDVDDHSSVYAWSEETSVTDCVFENDTPYRTTGKTGAQTACELHAARSRFVNNSVRNYYRACYVANNRTNDADEIVVANNTCGPLQGSGIALFNDSTTLVVRNADIHGNTFTLDDTTFPGVPGRKLCFDFSPAGACRAIQIVDNLCTKLGTSIPSGFFQMVASDTASQKHDQVYLKGNVVVGVSTGIEFKTTATNGLGYVEITGNTLLNVTPSGGDAGVGVSLGFVGSATAVDCLVLKGNNFIDARAVPSTPYGVFVNGGTYTTFVVGPNSYVGMQTAKYVEAVAPTITTRYTPDTPRLVTVTEAALVAGVDASVTDAFKVTLTAARAVGVPTGLTPGQRVTFTFVQDGTGGRAVTWNAAFKVSWSDTGNTANKRSSVSFVYDGTNLNQTSAQAPYV